MTAIETDKAEEAIAPDLLWWLLGTAHSVTELLDAALREVGLSATGFRLLSELVNALEPLEPHELEAAAFGPVADLEPLVDALERDGLVRRTPPPASATANGRAVRILVTARGRARQHAGARHVDALGLRLSEALAGVDRAAVARALSALR
jgi:DNA-binding MarR family transcriptional regulator